MTQQRNRIFTYSFCQSYIDTLVEYIENEFLIKRPDLSRLCVVFGGKRPALFVKKGLSKAVKTDFYPPVFFTIDEFMHYTARKATAFSSPQDMDNCYLMYLLARQNTPLLLKGRESFAEFLPWAREINAFIDQLDLEQVENKRLLSVQKNAEIGYPVPKDINRLLEHVVVLREAYHEELKKQGRYTRGLQYFCAAEHIGDLSFDEFDQILFCNFFYFHRTEEAVVKSLHKRGQATLIFQGDQRKWPVLDRIAKTFDCRLEEGESPQTPGFALNLYSGFDVHSQVGIVRQILSSLKNLDRTVVVVPDPGQIIPLLSELTAVVEDFNVSMGYPLRRSSLFNLCEFVFRAQLSRKERRYYSKDYLKALRHPFIKNLKAARHASTMRVLIHKIEEILTGKMKTDLSGSLFVELEEILSHEELYMAALETLERLGVRTDRRELRDVLGSVHALLFRDWEKVDRFRSFSMVMQRFLDDLTEKSFLKNYPLNINIASRMYDITDEFSNASFSDERFTQEEIFNIFSGKIERELISFAGSPLKGLQVLGLFETRSLNFENVVVLDVNEGVLPKLSIYEPLIPREVMISLNLDRLELEEEIQRYQFMRLLSSAKNVHLVYQANKEKERSRFVEELIWENQKQDQERTLATDHQASFTVQVNTARPGVRKTPAMIEALKKHTYSASSINTYLRNPMDFYWQYVLGLKQQDDLLDEPDARHVGVFVHELLEEAFAPFVGKKPRMNAAFTRRVERLFEDRFKSTFGRSMKSDSFLLKSVLKERIGRFLENEKTNEERRVDTILHLERRFEETIELECGAIKFAYVVDRIDQLKNGTILVIDYKTGSTDLMPKAHDHIARMDLSRESIRDGIKSFQVPLYFHYLTKEFDQQPVNAALYNLRSLKLSKFLDHRLSVSPEAINRSFMRGLNFIMEEILDPEVEFVTDETAY